MVFWRSAEIAGRADDREVIDLMLAHTQANKVETAYNRAAYMPRRRKLAQIWGDMLMQGLPKSATNPQKLWSDLPQVRLVGR
jgi:hypothetical protein